MYIRLASAVLLLTLISIGSRADAAEWMMQTTIGDQLIEGRPVAWSSSVVRLLGRDGQLHQFDPRKAKDSKKTSPRFHPLTDSQLRAELYREFDGRFDFTSTSNYLVVHPPSGGSEWAGRFEQIYRSLIGYLRVRGFRVREPEFPLVAIVLRSEGEYRRFVAKGGATVLPGALGHYDHYTNRVVLFDITGGAGDWSESAATIVHEATHQVAFNVGAHTRGADAPYWVAEGLAMLFEPRAMWRPRGSDKRSDRLNNERLIDFRHFSRDGEPPFSLAEFVASDQPFRRSGAAAYAQAWALAFYLAETQPRAYSQYLADIAARPPLDRYRQQARVADFRNAFGADINILQANWMRWVDEL
ncbi:MAG: DUF1570 domain-containing protein [Planctomycetota bacterium]